VPPSLIRILDARGATRVALSADAGTLYFVSDLTGTVQLWSVPAAGGVPRRLSYEADRVGAYRVSPDGTQIAYGADEGGDERWALWVMNADGTGQTRVTTDAGSDVSPSWNANGTRLAIDSDRSGNKDIWTVSSVDGSAPVNLTATNSGLDSDPDWSPDGQSILFVSQRPVISVWKMDADGSNQQDISSATNYDADPTWAPDGQHIAFVRDAGGVNFNVWTARPAIEGIFGNAQVQLTHAPAENCLGYTISDALSKTYVIQPPAANANCNITQDRSLEGLTQSSITFDNQSGMDVTLDWLEDDLNERRRHGLYRVRRRLQSAQGPHVRFHGRDFVNFSSNDYLNYAADPRLANAAARAARRYGCGAGASALVSGRLPPLRALERDLARWEGTEAALVFNSGYVANLAVVARWPSPMTPYSATP